MNLFESGKTEWPPVKTMVQILLHARESLGISEDDWTLDEMCKVRDMFPVGYRDIDPSLIAKRMRRLRKDKLLPKIKSPMSFVDRMEKMMRDFNKNRERKGTSHLSEKYNDSNTKELKALRRWHNWRDVDGTKIPIQVNGNAAKSNDPDTWTDFETADAFGPLAFELGDGFCGVDLDNCLDVFGELRSWAWKIVEKFDGVAYMEISPSGRGIKFITRGRKPVGSRCVHKIGDDKQQIECYDKARFWTVTGQVYNRQTEIGDGQAAIDWLCGEYLTTVAPAAYVKPIVSTGFALQQRAASYVDSVPPAGPGGRNNSAFSLAGHLWAMVGDFSERLTADQVLSNMRAWNATNFEPLSDEELQRVTDSAGRNGTPRADKISQPPVVTIDTGVDLSQFMKTTAKAAESHESFPLDCLQIPGLIGDLIQHNLKTAHYPLPELALAGALAVMSTVTGAKRSTSGAGQICTSWGWLRQVAGRTTAENSTVRS
jgi:hypothetical protein